MDISSKFNNGAFKYTINNQLNVNKKANPSNVKLPEANKISIGTVENLTIDEIMDMFAHGNLTKTEMEKWLVYHRKDINNLSYTEQNGLITYKFEYKGKEFKIQCLTEAAKSQTDNKTQETFLLSTLKNVYYLTNKQIAENFVAAVSVGGNVQCYTLNPNSQFNSIADLMKSIEDNSKINASNKDVKNSEEIKSSENDEGNANISNFDVDGSTIDYTQIFPEDYQEMIQTHLGKTIQEVGEIAASQGLTLTLDEIEMNKGRIVAQDEEGMYYHYNSVNNDFVRLQPDDWVNIILGKGTIVVDEASGKKYLRTKVKNDSGEYEDFQMFIATDFRPENDKYINVSDIMREVNRQLSITGVNISAMFGDKDSVTIDELYELYSSNNTSVKKMFQLFEDAFEIYECQDIESEKQILTNIIAQLNIKNGVENTSPVTLTKALVQELNKKGKETNKGVIYNQIKEIINSENLSPLNEVYTKLLDEVYERLNCSTDVQKEKVKDSIIKLYNQNNEPQIKSINDLTEASLETVQKILDSTAFKFTYNCDGNIGDFTRGNASISAMTTMIALASTPDGQEIINNIINNMVWDADYETVSITVPAGKTYTFKVDMGVCDDNPEQKLYTANGDYDAQLLSRIFMEVTKSSEGIYYTDYKPAYSTLRNFFGIKGTTQYDKSIFHSDIKNVLNQLYSTKLSGEGNYLFTFTLYSSADSIPCVDGSTFEHPKYNQIGYVVTDITSDTVTFADSTDSTKVYTVPWDAFQELNMYTASTEKYTTKIETLLDKTEGVTSDYLIDNWDELHNSEEIGTQKFVKLFDSAFKSLELMYDVDQKDFMNFFINWFNKENNIETSTPPKFNYDTITKFEDDALIEQMRGIINDGTFAVQYLSDGVIGEFLQGSEGDCWLLGALDALSSNPAGAEIISNAITWPDEDHINVHFAGINEDIILDVDDIMSLFLWQTSNKNEKHFSRGDIDTLIVEYAVEKLFDEKGYNDGNIRNNTPVLFWKLFLDETPNRVMVNGHTESNWPCFVQYADEINENGEITYGNVTKPNGKFQFYTVQDIIENLYNAFNSGNMACAVFTLHQGYGGEERVYTDEEGNVTEVKTYFSATDVNGKLFEYETGSGHVYSIKNVEMVNGKYYITFSNPWNNDYFEYTLDLDSLINLGLFNIDYVV